MENNQRINYGAIGAFINALKNNNNVLVDDHTGEEKAVDHIALFGNLDNQKIVYLPHSSKWNSGMYCSVNELYIEDGVVHLSTRSIGGVIQHSQGCTLPLACEAYNEGFPEGYRSLFMRIFDLTLEEPSWQI